MLDLRQMAMNMLTRNPNVANNPQAKNYLQVIQNGSPQQGEQIAENICRTYGMTKEQALERAKQFFGLKG